MYNFIFIYITTSMCCNVDNNVLFSHVAMCVCVFILSLYTLLVQINERFIAHMVAEYYF